MLDKMTGSHSRRNLLLAVALSITAFALSTGQAMASAWMSYGGGILVVYGQPSVDDDIEIFNGARAVHVKQNSGSLTAPSRSSGCVQYSSNEVTCPLAMSDRISVVLGSGNDDLNSSTGIWDTTVYAGDGRDYINLAGSDDTVYGDPGSDVIWAGAGADYIVGGSDNDDIHGQDGRGTISVAGDRSVDPVACGNGTDTVRANDSSATDSVASGCENVFTYSSYSELGTLDSISGSDW